jgi:hypothetical protein
MAGDAGFAALFSPLFCLENTQQELPVFEDRKTRKFFDNIGGRSFHSPLVEGTTTATTTMEDADFLPLRLLPLEVQHTVLDHLDTKDDLINASLVCRQWSRAVWGLPASEGRDDRAAVAAPCVSWRRVFAEEFPDAVRAVQLRLQRRSRGRTSALRWPTSAEGATQQEGQHFDLAPADLPWRLAYM